MKLSLIFSLFVLLVACSTTKPLDNLTPIAKISEGRVFYGNGNKSKLPTLKGENTLVVYLVRHAEKAKEGGRDPMLTEAGRQRAIRLSTILAETGIDEIYSTEYQRTQLTATPTADLLGKKVKAYNPRDLEGFANELKTTLNGKTVLVVGHSNTTPTLVNYLVGTEKFPMIDEKEYGDFFSVTISKGGAKKAVLLKY